MPNPQLEEVSMNKNCQRRKSFCSVTQNWISVSVTLGLQSNYIYKKVSQNKNFFVLWKFLFVDISSSIILFNVVYYCLILFITVHLCILLLTQSTLRGTLGTSLYDVCYIQKGSGYNALNSTVDNTAYNTLHSTLYSRIYSTV